MDIHFIPCQDEFLIYRPLRPLAFLGNRGMKDYLERRIAGGEMQRDDEVEAFLDDVDFWQPDPPSPDAWRPPDDHRPTAGVLLMTSACNLRCTYCYAYGGEGPLKQMTFPLAKSVIDEVHRNARVMGKDVFSLTFHGGGEPTANWDVLTAAVEYAQSKDLPCEITMSTNGLLSETQRRFVVENFSNVSLSFDGISEVQNAQRPTPGDGDSFEPVMRTIRTFDLNGFPYGIRMTVAPQFFHTLPESVAFLCEETACTSIQIEPAYTGERGEHGDPGREQCDDFVTNFTAAFEVSCRYGRPLSYSGARPLVVSTSFCKAGSDAVIATPDGKLVSCFEIHDDSHPLAELFTVGSVSPAEETADDLSNLLPIIDAPGPAVRFDRDALDRYADGEHARREMCEGCSCYWHCAGDCATRRTASVTATEGRCHVNREITRELLLWYVAAGDGVWRGEQTKSRSVPVGVAALPSMH